MLKGLENMQIESEVKKSVGKQLNYQGLDNFAFLHHFQR